MIYSHFQIPEFSITKIANSVLIPKRDVLQLLLFRKLVVIVVSSNKLRKKVLTNSMASGSKNVFYDNLLNVVKN